MSIHHYLAVNKSIKTLLRLSILLLIFAFDCHADTHYAFDNYTIDSNWFVNASRKTYDMKDYNIVDEYNPVADVYPYELLGTEQVISLDSKTITFSTVTPLSAGIAKLRFKYAKVDYKTNPSTINVAVTASDGYSQTYSISVDDDLLYKSDGDYYCQAHTAEFEFEATADASVVISATSRYNTFECIIWDVSYDDYTVESDQPQKPLVENWHNDYTNRTEFSDLIDFIADFEADDLAEGETVDLDNVGYVFSEGRNTYSEIQVNFENAQLIRTADAWAIDFEQGGTITIEAKIVPGYSFARLNAIRILHQQCSDAVFDYGYLDEDSGCITYWTAAMASEQSFKVVAKASNIDNRVVSFTTLTPLRVYGVAVAEPYVVTHTDDIVVNCSDSALNLWYDLRGIKVTNPQQGAIYISITSDGAKVVRF